MPTSDKLRDLIAKPGGADSATFVFCTKHDKITVTIRLTDSSTQPLVITFKAEARKLPKGETPATGKEWGWVQFVEEGSAWYYDNATKQPPVGEEVPKKTPPSVTYEAEEEGEKDETIPLDIWYGNHPKKPQREIRDTPGPGNAVVTAGPNAKATRKRFVTRFVCRGKKKDGSYEDGTHEFELRWNLYRHREKGWTKLTLSGNKPTKLNAASDDCP